MYPAFGKRLFDILISGTALLILSPVLLIIAAGAKLSTPGPAIFRQQRIGAGGVPFEIYKFRSMPVDTGDIPSDAVGSVDIAPFGMLIRRTNLDELPQLFNILKGDMSVVGPRPALASQAHLLELRHRDGSIQCRPGLTGLAQINGYDGMPVEEKARKDCIYADRITLFGDLTIIARTFGYLLRPPPVY